eukprot:1142049-Pelagomonas_calceolata.AAC.4
MDGPLASNAESDHNAEAAAARFQRNLALAFSSDDKEADPPQPPKYTLKSKGFFGHDGVQVDTLGMLVSWGVTAPFASAKLSL